jgi:glycosyltransferase involved in cell wall biosynthesis
MADARPLRILQISTGDVLGGAERVAWNLFEHYRRLGHASWLAVGDKRTADPDVLVISGDRSAGRGPDTRPASTSGASPVRVWRAAKKWLPSLKGPVGPIVERFENYWGLEDFRYPATWNLLDLVQPRPDIVHCHNLHGGYFDLRALPWLSQQVPLVLTLHDAWLLSGHCAHSFDCERWRIGCGRCPDLSIVPEIRRDATAYNWRRKQRLYERSRLRIATPSKWLMNKVAQSMLGATDPDVRVIPNGVDLTIFRPRRQEARTELQIAPDDKVIMCAANGIQQNIWKDYHTARAAVGIVAERMCGQRLRFLALGEDAPPQQIGSACVEFVPHQSRPEDVARYYQAADVYVHAARADTFPNTVLEALACGTPVVATEVGGIPEQIRPLDSLMLRTSHAPVYTESSATGVLVAQGDAQGMAAPLEHLLRNGQLRDRLGQNARRDAEHRFDLHAQVNAYLEWYHQLLQNSVTDRTGKTAPRGETAL